MNSTIFTSMDDNVKISYDENNVGTNGNLEISSTSSSGDDETCLALRIV